jgi:hypothetical protein
VELPVTGELASQVTVVEGKRYVVDLIIPGLDWAKEVNTPCCSLEPVMRWTG